jgi:hypothetical protein
MWADRFRCGWLLLGRKAMVVFYLLSYLDQFPPTHSVTHQPIKGRSVIHSLLELSVIKVPLQSRRKETQVKINNGGGEEGGYESIKLPFS